MRLEKAFTQLEMLFQEIMSANKNKNKKTLVPGDMCKELKVSAIYPMYDILYFVHVSLKKKKSVFIYLRGSTGKRKRKNSSHKPGGAEGDGVPAAEQEVLLRA